MLRFVVQKLIHKKWMVCSILIGNILLAAVACSNSMYTDASLQRMLTDDLAAYLEDRNIYPGRMVYTAEIRNTAQSPNPFVAAFKRMEQKAGQASADFQTAVKDQVRHYSLTDQRCLSVLEKDGEQQELTVNLGFLSELPEHAALLSGSMYSDTLGEDGVIEAVISQKAMVALNLLVGEEVEFERIKMPDGRPLRVRVSGIFENSQEDDTYWVNSPNAYSAELFIAEAVFRSQFMELENPLYSVRGEYFVLLDYTDMKPELVSHYLEKAAQIEEEFVPYTTLSYRCVFQKVLEEFQTGQKKIETTLMVLQVPVLVLLGAFIFMISRQMLEMEQNEIALFKSRGAGRGQIIGIYLLQSLLLGIVGFLAGIPFGSFLCRALGSTRSFLEFVQRRNLAVTFTPEVVLYAAVAAFAALSAMVLPVFRYAKVGIVDYKRKKNRKSERALWQKVYLDVVLLAVGLYGCYSFTQQKDIILEKVLTGKSIDPLLFLSSSVFIIGAALVSLRFIPLLVRLVYLIGKRWWSPSFYASFLQILRTGSRQRFIMAFLMLTIALGVFNSTTARTILANAEENVRYQNGADIVLSEVWRNNADAVESGQAEELVYTEPDFGKYEELDGMQNITRVYRREDVTVSSGREKISNIKVLGIHTKEFGETAYFNEELFPVPYQEYLNVLAGDAKAILVSSNFRDNYGYKLGDILYFNDKTYGTAYGVIYGFVDYWPGYAPSERALQKDGILAVTQNYLVVAHDMQIQEQWGIFPYEVWLRADGAAKALYDRIEEDNMEFTKFQDTRADLLELRNDTVFQGTNGIITISFIVVLLLCAVGFLIYWLLSIRSRELLFGVFRAMGMSMREVLVMLVNEQIFISGLSIAVGGGIGMLASNLFIPLIEISYAASDQAVPLKIITESGDMIRLFAVVFAVLLLCMVIIGIQVSKLNISQALKLGED